MRDMPSAQRRPGSSRAAAGAPAPQPSPHSRSESSGTVLAFDYGEKRVGVAVGELCVGVAHPLTTVHAEGRQRQIAALAPLITEWKPGLVVVGIPLHPDGKEHDLTRAARRFASRLESVFRIPAVLIDERYTSASADSTLRDAGVSGSRRRGLLDPVAAQHILQAFFDERR